MKTIIIMFLLALVACVDKKNEAVKTGIYKSMVHSKRQWKPSEYLDIEVLELDKRPDELKDFWRYRTAKVKFTAKKDMWKSIDSIYGLATPDEHNKDPKESPNPFKAGDSFVTDLNKVIVYKDDLE